MDPRRAFGNEGERAAERHLAAKGLKVLGRQVRTPSGEIDLVCEDGPELVFVEVKARRSAAFGMPEESVTRRKFEAMLRAAEHYLRANAAEGKPWRIDVVSVTPEGILHIPAIDGPSRRW